MACRRFQLQGRLLHNEDSESCLSCMQRAYWSSSTFLPNMIKICLRVSKLWSAHGWGYNISDSGEITTYRIVRVVSCMGHAYWSSSSLPNIIKLSQTVWELRPADYFSFRGDNYITKTVRVVSLACNMLIGPPSYSYQILSKYVHGYQSYGANKDASTDGRQLIAISHKLTGRGIKTKNVSKGHRRPCMKNLTQIANAISDTDGDGLRNNIICFSTILWMAGA